jgi:DNA-binding protein YbaB
MAGERYWGSALNDAVEVAVDEHGMVARVELDDDVVRRLWAEQLGDAVVQAHTEARGSR